MADNILLARAAVEAAASATKASNYASIATLQAMNARTSATSSASSSTAAASSAAAASTSATAAATSAASAAASAASVTDLATTTPGAGKIPIAGEDGKLDAEWLPTSGGGGQASGIGTATVGADGILILDFPELTGFQYVTDTSIGGATVNGIDPTAYAELEGFVTIMNVSGVTLTLASEVAPNGAFFTTSILVPNQSFVTLRITHGAFQSTAFSPVGPPTHRFAPADLDVGGDIIVQGRALASDFIDTVNSDGARMSQGFQAGDDSVVDGNLAVTTLTVGGVPVTGGGPKGSTTGTVTGPNLDPDAYILHTVDPTNIAFIKITALDPSNTGRILAGLDATTTAALGDGELVTLVNLSGVTINVQESGAGPSYFSVTALTLIDGNAMTFRVADNFWGDGKKVLFQVSPSVGAG